MFTEAWFIITETQVKKQPTWMDLELEFITLRKPDRERHTSYGTTYLWNLKT